MPVPSPKLPAGVRARLDKEAASISQDSEKDKRRRAAQKAAETRAKNKAQAEAESDKSEGTSSGEDSQGTEEAGLETADQEPTGSEESEE